MKKQFLSAKTLMLAALILVVSACTIKHKFEQPPLVVNNYYGGGGDGFSGENNTLSTSDLGVGYDITRADPYVWSRNSVSGVAVRPKVFTFLPDPDPDQTVDLGKLNRDATRRRKPLGVNVDASPEFSWEEGMDFVYDASDFQTSNGGHVSAGGGAMGVAFSASASYKSAQQKTAVEEKTVASKNGAYKALKMEIDFSVPQQFTKQFRDAVQHLGQNPLTYDTFIYNWGTHFSRVATVGANCAYRMEFKNSEMSKNYTSEESFEAGVKGSMAGVSVEAGAGYVQKNETAIKKSTGAESITFVSYGGSGAGINDYTLWTEHAVENPTLIDVYLTPYDSIFTKAFFPKDPLILTKQDLFRKALLRYYNKANSDIKSHKKATPISWQQPSPQTFKVILNYLKATKAGNGTEDRLYAGVVALGVYDKLGKQLKFGNVINFSGPGVFLKLKKDQVHNYTLVYEYEVQPDQLEGIFVTITGQMTQNWGAANSMGNKIAVQQKSTDEAILLTDFDTVGFVKDATAKYANDNDEIEIRFQVMRIK